VQDSNTGALVAPKSVSVVDIATNSGNEIKSMLEGLKTEVKHIGWIIIALGISFWFLLKL
jgi:hypothetical protein